MFKRRNAWMAATGFLCLWGVVISAQDQKIADSLAIIYRQQSLPDTAKLELLRNLAFNESRNLTLGLQYAEELIELSSKLNNSLYLYRGYLQKGNKKRMLGDLEDALEAYIQGAEAARSAQYLKGVGSTYGAIADIYGISGNHQNAISYYRRSINMLRQIKDSLGLAAAILNAGDEFLNKKFFDSAYAYFIEADQLFSALDYSIGRAYAAGNLGMVFHHRGEHQRAEQKMHAAIAILEEAGDYYPICVYLLSIADIYKNKGDVNAAISYARRSLDMAQQHALKDQISAAFQKLSILYEQRGQAAIALDHYKQYILYRDSVNDISTVQKLADLRTDFEVSLKQREVDLLNREKSIQQFKVGALSIILVLCLIILGILIWYSRLITLEKNKSDALLLNILPEETARELKKKGRVDAVRFERVTVLFTDFVEFTKQTERIEAEQLVKSVDFYFKAFDEITTKYGLEKIKTIGDAYMCASGIPASNKSNARDIILAAREMISWVNNTHLHPSDMAAFDMRLGAHTGPVVAGVAGIKKWQYDIWGDTVNIASRMESNSEPGKINLSETTYEEIKNEFNCTYRGELEVKNLGTMKMYFLD